MGACRFLAYLMAALAAGNATGAAVIGAAGLFAHVVGLTYAARQEAYDRLDRAWPLMVLAVPLLVALGFAVIAGSALALALLIAYAAWGARSLRLLLRRKTGDVPGAVVGLIAAISLYDAALIAAAGAPWLALLAAAGFLATLALQRVAPGT
jgi:4-hydroxybenzoate polyprenyltransferase